MEELGVEKYDTPTDGMNAFVNSNGISYYRGLVPPLGSLCLLNYAWVERKVCYQLFSRHRADNVQNDWIHSMTLYLFKNSFLGVRKKCSFKISDLKRAKKKIFCILRNEYKQSDLKIGTTD